MSSVKNRYFFLLFVVVTFLPIDKISSQDLGFGCLGLIGGFVGYEIQNYKSETMNLYSQFYNEKNKNSLVDPFKKFGEARGFRFGLNLFRNNFSGFIVTIKTSYQDISEKDNQVIFVNGSEQINMLELNLKNYSLGIDLGTTITPALSWKVIEASLIYYQAEIIETVSPAGMQSSIKYYTHKNPEFGYNLGTGFILHLIKNYISLEGSASFSIFNIKEVSDENGKVFFYDNPEQNLMQTRENLIKSGGVNLVIQLNIGFPI
ncbi:MAG: hypothetical protein C0425_04575 [Chlorobiaceae bacterium]|nr:hypothetical protein [Chlorobiaceae bacterium]MBA4309591.1 hypothetical protein [Chlorobiaceae bacterium]